MISWALILASSPAFQCLTLPFFCVKHWKLGGAEDEATLIVHCSSGMIFSRLLSQLGNLALMFSWQGPSHFLSSSSQVHACSHTHVHTHTFCYRCWTEMVGPRFPLNCDCAEGWTQVGKWQLWVTAADFADVYFIFKLAHFQAVIFYRHVEWNVSSPRFNQIFDWHL